jgi:hypothetical protein
MSFEGKKRKRRRVNGKCKKGRKREYKEKYEIERVNKCKMGKNKSKKCA